MPRPSRLAPPHLDVPVRRSLGRARDAAHADAAGPRARAAAWCCSAASRARARAGSSASSPREAADGRRARPLRRLRRRRAHAVRAVRRGARPARARITDPAELRAGARRRRRRADPPAARPARRGSATCRPPVEADPDTERHRLHTAVADLLAGVSATPAGAAGDRGRALGGRARRCCCCATSRAPPDDARVLLLATFRDTEADVPEALSETLADLRRSDDVVRLRLGGLSGDEVAEFVRRAGGRRPRPRAARARRGDPRPHRGQRRSWSASCGATLVETGAVEVDRRRDPADAAAGRARQPRERARGRQPAARPARRRRRRDLLELARRGRAGVRARRRARAPRGLDEPELLAALDEAVAQRDDRGAARRPGWPTASRTSSCGARSTTGCPACAAPSCTCASARRSRRRPALRPRARRPRAPLRRRRAVRRGRARRSSTTCCAARAATAALAFDEAGDAAAHRARARDRRRRAERAERLARARRRPATAAARRSTRSRRSGRRRDIARELGDARAARAGGDRLRGRLLAPGDRRPGRGRAARGGVGRARRGATRSCASACSAGSLARSTSRATTSAARSSARAPIAMARRAATTAPALATVLMRSYWSRGASSLEEILAMLTEARDSASELGDTEIRAEAMAWRVADVRRARRPRVRPARGRRAARDRRADGAAVHAPRRRALRLGDRARATAASTRPRRWRERSHEWSRLLTGRDAVRRLRHPDVQHPPRAGAAGRARAGDPDPRRRRRPRRPVAARARRGARRARHGGRGAAGARADRRRRARAVPRVAVARLAHLPDRRLRGARRRGDGRARLSRARAARRRRT